MDWDGVEEARQAAREVLRNNRHGHIRRRLLLPHKPYFALWSFKEFSNEPLGATAYKCSTCEHGYSFLAKEP